MEQGTPHDVTLDYELSLSSTELVIEYKVTNGGEEPIWLTTPLASVADDGKAVADPQRVYAYLDPDGVLHVTKRMWPIPEDVDVYAPEPGFSTEVLPGRTFAETLRLPVPVEKRVGYAWLDTGGKRVQEPDGVASAMFSFSIEYTRGPLEKAGEQVPVRLCGEPVELVVAVKEAG